MAAAPADVIVHTIKKNSKIKKENTNARESEKSLPPM
jgi:hypothetical protein